MMSYRGANGEKAWSRRVAKKLGTVEAGRIKRSSPSVSTVNGDHQNHTTGVGSLWGVGWGKQGCSTALCYKAQVAARPGKVSDNIPSQPEVSVSQTQSLLSKAFLRMPICFIAAKSLAPTDSNEQEGIPVETDVVGTRQHKVGTHIEVRPDVGAKALTTMSQFAGDLMTQRYPSKTQVEASGS